MTDHDHHDDRVQETLDQILAEARTTNGRVHRLWVEVFGDDESGRVGLVQQARETDHVVQIIKQFITVLKWFAVTAAGAIVVGLVNLAQQAL